MKDGCNVITAGPIVSVEEASGLLGGRGPLVSISTGPLLGLSGSKEPEGRNLPADRTLWLARSCPGRTDARQGLGVDLPPGLDAPSPGS